MVYKLDHLFLVFKDFSQLLSLLFNVSTAHHIPGWANTSRAVVWHYSLDLFTDMTYYSLRLCVR